jgi:FMN reductase
MSTPTSSPAPLVRVVALSAGVSTPSATRLLVDRVQAQLHGDLTTDGYSVHLTTLDLGTLAADVARALVGGPSSPALHGAFDALAAADVIVAGAPIYKAGISGLFKSFVDLIDDDLLLGKTVILAATAGTARHALVVDDHLRPLFAFMRTVTAPTSVFAAPDDWADPALGRRIRRATREAMALYRVEMTAEVAHSWDAYQHSFGSVQSQRAGHDSELDFTTPLMRLAAGGS